MVYIESLISSYLFTENISQPCKRYRSKEALYNNSSITLDISRPAWSVLANIN